MNFILDIGNVLICFKPKRFLHDRIGNPELEARLLKAIFLGPEWAKADEGTITREEACAVICKREPEYAAAIRLVMDNLTKMFTPIAETVELLPKIKAAGHSLYYLSNYSREGREFILAEYKFFEHFDGGVFSCDVHVTKPSPGIYSILLNKYQLSAADCLFFDDIEENVKAAESVGMKGILFTNAQDIKQYI